MRGTIFFPLIFSHRTPCVQRFRSTRTNKFTIPLVLRPLLSGQKGFLGGPKLYCISTKRHEMYGTVHHVSSAVVHIAYTYTLYYIMYSVRVYYTICVWRLVQSDNSRWHTWFIGPLTLLDRIIICRENELHPVSMSWTHVYTYYVIYKCQYVYYTIWIWCAIQIYTIKPNKL